MKKYIRLFTISLILFLNIGLASADDGLYSRVSGRILLQTESAGQAWYINPKDQKKYYLGRPDDAFAIMRGLAIGITNTDLNKIPVSTASSTLMADEDLDGLNDNLENAYGTNPRLSDTDNDGYNDKTELDNNHDPLSTSTSTINLNFTKKHAGKIFLQVEKLGQAWYVNPSDHKRYFLGRPADAFTIMRALSLGATNYDLDKIVTGYLPSSPPPVCPLCQPTPPPVVPPIVNPPTTPATADGVFQAAAAAIRAGKTAEAKTYFIDTMQPAIDYTMNFLDTEGKFTLGNIMSGASLKSQTTETATYSTDVYFSLGGYKVPVNFIVEKQPDGKWLLTNL